MDPPVDVADISAQIAYLAAKRTVDDRALNPHVWQAFWRDLPAGRLRVLEIGCGIGTMAERILEAGLLPEAEYVAVDLNPQFLAEASRRLRAWAEARSLPVEAHDDGLAISGEHGLVRFRFVEADAQDDLKDRLGAGWDRLIAHALLDLLNMEATVPALLDLLAVSGKYLFSLNFDGVTCFLPPLDPALDRQIERLYHQTMEARRSGGRPTGGRHAGRRLLALLLELPAAIEAVGGSDWAVHPIDGRYPDQEAAFLTHLLATVGTALEDHPALPGEQLARWLKARRRQLAQGELVLLTHQLDVCGRRA